MVTLFDVTLDLARHVRGISRHKITSVDILNNSFTCADMTNRSGEYAGGTVWIMTGEAKGTFWKIKSAVNQTLTMQDYDYEDLYAVGDYVCICPWIDFNLNELIEAINSVLYRYPILAMDDSLTWNSGKQEYETPEGVSDIRRIQVENSNGNGQYTISHCWTEDKDEHIRFHSTPGLYADGGTIQIYYRKLHDELYDYDDKLDPSVDLVYLRNMAFLYLWRQILVTQHKDNPVAADMYNEAKMYEQEHTKFNTPERNIPIRDFYTR